MFIVKCSWDGLPEGSRGILLALFLTLDKYSSWRVGRAVPMIRSADDVVYPIYPT